jgi:hypothetical protein
MWEGSRAGSDDIPESRTPDTGTGTLPFAGAYATPTPSRLLILSLRRNLSTKLYLSLDQTLAFDP